MSQDIVLKLKAKVVEEAEWDAKLKVAVDMDSSETHVLEQTEFLYAARLGCRLKLRTQENVESGLSNSELLSYKRAKIEGANCKLIKYESVQSTPVQEPKTMEQALGLSNGMMGRVDKFRQFFVVDWKGQRARVLLDEVHGLGHFVQLELDVNDGSDKTEMDEAKAFFEKYAEMLNLRMEDAQTAAYLMMLHKKQKEEEESTEDVVKLMEIIKLE